MTLPEREYEIFDGPVQSVIKRLGGRERTRIDAARFYNDSNTRMTVVLSKDDALTVWPLPKERKVRDLTLEELEEDTFLNQTDDNGVKIKRERAGSIYYYLDHNKGMRALYLYEETRFPVYTTPVVHVRDGIYSGNGKITITGMDDWGTNVMSVLISNGVTTTGPDGPTTQQTYTGTPEEIMAETFLLPGGTSDFGDYLSVQIQAPGIGVTYSYDNTTPLTDDFDMEEPLYPLYADNNETFKVGVSQPQWSTGVYRYMYGTAGEIQKQLNAKQYYYCQIPQVIETRIGESLMLVRLTDVTYEEEL